MPYLGLIMLAVMVIAIVDIAGAEDFASVACPECCGSCW